MPRPSKSRRAQARINQHRDYHREVYQEGYRAGHAAGVREVIQQLAEAGAVEAKRRGAVGVAPSEPTGPIPFVPVDGAAPSELESGLRLAPPDPDDTIECDERDGENPDEGQ